ncbi:TIGR02206 family membrane protein [Paenibacillus sp. J22TS3]|uniref:YwaF family protein n=1 Tax=Paenibacillus sp. J22TS3 TaxID=2807192 RepID=UPI001B1C9E0E|nr:TIGR02206 family membrane protein [Paenibacillus sp. J22TS3]GIP24471.1 ABC transporter permease [Paenibacillus sp. J22TS3]
MQHYFSVEEPGLFHVFSISHLLVLGLFLILVLLLYLGRGPLRQPARSRAVRYSLAGILILCELSLNVWYVWGNRFDVRDTLPLELCSISLYLCVFMLLFQSLAIFRIVYFTGIGGALQAILTPALSYPFPHFRFIEFFAAHMAIILSVLYMLWVQGFRPRLRDVGITMIFLNILLVLILFINRLTGGNYMFLSHKPQTASLMDYLGPYPWYIVSLETVACVIFLLLYLPFALKNRKKGSKNHNSRSYEI